MYFSIRMVHLLRCNEIIPRENSDRETVESVLVARLSQCSLRRSHVFVALNQRAYLSHIDERLHGRIRARDRQLALGPLRRHIGAYQRAKTGRIHIGDAAKIQNNLLGCFFARGLLERKDRMNRQRTVEFQNFLPGPVAVTRNNLQGVVRHGRRF